MTRAGGTPAARGRNAVVRRFIIASVAILLLAQMLNGVLTFAAVRNTTFKGFETATRIVGHDWAFRIQNALRFGKPITQMFGLPEMLQGIRADLPFLSGVVVTLPGGEVVESDAQEVPPQLGATIAAALARHDGGGETAGDRIPLHTEAAAGGDSLFILPVSNYDGSVAGTLTFIMPRHVVVDATRAPIRENLVYLAVTTAAGALALIAGAVLLRSVLFAQRGRRPAYLMPILVLVIVQGLYSWTNVAAFRTEYVESAGANVQRAIDRFGDDLERLVAKGVRLDHLAGLDAPFSRAMADIPELASLSLLDASGGTIAYYGPDRVLRRQAPPAAGAGAVSRRPIAAPGGTVAGTLVATLSPAAIEEGVRQRILDAGTVVLTSALFVVELLILFAVLMRSLLAPAARTSDDARDQHHMLARPAAFSLLFAWALPLSFVPLRMGALYEPTAGLPRDIVLALPISAEMFCALVTALAAGWLTDRKGWHVPFLAGSLLCALGAAASAVAAGMAGYVAARGLVGLGYGLAWMGIQGYLFTWGGRRTRTQGIANLIAGIFAGHICGSATGAMLADQLGYEVVFLVSALAGLAPILFALIFMRRYFGLPPEPEAVPALAIETAAPASLRRLIRDRGFVSLLAFSVIPFSVAQVGLLYYTLPVYLSQQGMQQSNIGRIMMLYGLSVIYLGPLLGRWVDRHAAKKPFIVLGGLVGGAGLAFIYFDASIAALIASVFLLGLASSLGGPAQSSFALRLPAVRRIGTGRAMGVQRAADKLGQMLGPLAVGALFTAVGTRNGLAITGLYYLACTALFWAIVRDRGGTAPAGGE